MTFRKSAKGPETHNSNVLPQRTPEGAKFFEFKRTRVLWDLCGTFDAVCEKFPQSAKKAALGRGYSLFTHSRQLFVRRMLRA